MNYLHPSLQMILAPLLLSSEISNGFRKIGDDSYGFCRICKAMLPIPACKTMLPTKFIQIIENS